MTRTTVLSAVRNGAILMALGGIVGCSGSGQNGAVSGLLVAPSAAGTNAAGGTVRYYTPSVSLGSVGAGSTTTFSVTLKNCDGTGTCATSVTSNNQEIGSATVDVQGFTVDPDPLKIVVTASAGKSWTASPDSGTITLLASGGTDRLDIGESVTVTFSATAPCASGSHTWTTHAYQDTTLPSSTEYERVGPQPSVAVTGNCTTVCALGQGYWKNHDTWPVSSLTLGSVSYSASQLEDIFNTPVEGNGLVSLAHQLIAAKLNIANGVDGSAVAGTIAAADAIIGALIVPPVGGGSLEPSATGALTEALDAFNNSCSN